MRKIIIFSDGSLQSKALEYELSHPLDPDIGFNIHRINVELGKEGRPDLERYFEEIQKLENNHKFDSDILALTRMNHPNLEIFLLFLHYSGEDFKKFDIEYQLKQIRAKYPNIPIVCAYRFMTRKTIESNAKKYGIKQ